jgi:hypothetical protein
VVRDDGDVVIWWDRFKHGHGESHVVLILCISLMQHEGIINQDNLSINVFHHDEEISAVPWIFSSQQKPGIMDRSI